jgi:hypothetical protein
VVVPGVYTALFDGFTVRVTAPAQSLFGGWANTRMKVKSIKVRVKIILMQDLIEF